VTPQSSDEGSSVAAIIGVLRSVQGLDLTPYDESFLCKAIDKRVQATGSRSREDYAALLAEQRAEAETLTRSLRISYTDFFRNPLAFALLEQRILPALIAAREQVGHGEIRVWSAGCAAGQEAWSVAMLLDELTQAHEPPLAYRIFASDLAEPELAVGRAGEYPANALGNVRQRHLHACFCQHGDNFAIAPRLRARVDFSAYDLLDEGSSSPQASIYGDFELSLCCNLLFYYRPAVQQRILAKICRALTPGGYLVTGETEHEIVPNTRGCAPWCRPQGCFKNREFPSDEEPRTDIRCVSRDIRVACC